MKGKVTLWLESPANHSHTQVLKLYYHPTVIQEEARHGSRNKNRRRLQFHPSPLKWLANHNNTHFNSSTGEAEAGCLSSRPIKSTEWIPGQLEIKNKTKQNEKTNKQKLSMYLQTSHVAQTCNLALRKQRQEDFNFNHSLGFNSLKKKRKKNSCKFTLLLFLLLKIKWTQSLLGWRL